MKRLDEERIIITDNELVARAINNDQSAFSELAERYRQPVLSFIQNFTGNLQDAEDITQECFDKAFRNLKKFNPEYAFSTWLYSIAQNTSVDHYRKKRGQPITPLTHESSLIPSPEEKMINEQTIGELRRAIANLDEIYREVATLRYIHEYAYEEIAKELNIPINTVKTRLNRARSFINKRWKS